MEAHGRPRIGRVRSGRGGSAIRFDPGAARVDTRVATWHPPARVPSSVTRVRMFELPVLGLVALVLAVLVAAFAMELFRSRRRRSSGNDEAGAKATLGIRLAVLVVAVAVVTLGGWYLAVQESVRERVTSARPSQPSPGAVSAFVAARGVDLEPFERAVHESVESALADGASTDQAGGWTGVSGQAPFGFAHGQWSVGVRPGTSGQPFHRVVDFDVFLDELLLRLDPSVGAALDARELRLVCTFRATDESMRSAVLVRLAGELAFEEVHPYGVLDEFDGYDARPPVWPEADEVDLAPRSESNGR